MKLCALYSTIPMIRMPPFPAITVSNSFFRFQHDEDVPEWQKGLMAWKAYSLEHDSLHSETSSDGGEVNDLDDIVIGDTGDSSGVAMNPLTPPDSNSKQKNQQASYQSVASPGKDNYDKFEIVRLESGNMSTPPEIMSGEIRML